MLVINETKVIPARLIGVKEDSGVVCEVLLLKRIDTTHWEALVNQQKAKTRAQVLFGNGKLKANIINNTDFGGRIVSSSTKAYLKPA